MARLRPTRRAFNVLLFLLVLAVGGVAFWRATADTGPKRPAGSARGGSETSAASRRSEAPPATPTPTAAPTPSTVATPGPVNTKIPGLTTFRGNLTRDYYGEGPVPEHPRILWSYPASGGMCSQSSAGGVTKTWCGTGWTGQPNVIPRRNGTIEIREGAYDAHYHFWNGLTGAQLRPDLVTGDLAKGSATSDPDGYPLYYGGSRDNLLRVVALDRPAPTVLWSFDADSQPNGQWNNDWDGAPLVVGDYLLEGGENSWFYVIHLHRSYDGHHQVQVSPQIVMRVPGWDSQELADIHDGDISIENSVAYDANRGVVYFSNSGGLVQGWDISDVLNGGSSYHRVFRFWTGDDTDASVVIGPDGDLYVASEYQRFLPRAREVGQIMKLDPRKPNDPIVWSIHETTIAYESAGGSWSTPALYGDYVYASTVDGKTMEIRQDTGKIVWTLDLAAPLLSSPVPIDGTLIQGDCGGVLHAWDISDPKRPPKTLWNLTLGGCIESTPAVWHGMMWVGTRGGKFFGIGD